MRKSLTLPLLAAILFTIAACDPYSSWEKSVVNNSSKDIIIYTSSSGGGFTFEDSVIVAPSENIVIYAVGEAVKSELSDCDLYISRLSVKTDSGFIVTKNIQDVANWESSTTDADQGFDHGCVYTVTDSDITEE
jgi:hypothetical protein